MKYIVALIIISSVLMSCTKRFNEPLIIKDISLDEPCSFFVIPNSVKCDDEVLVLQSCLNLSDISVVRFNSSGVTGKNKLDLGADYYGFLMYYVNQDSIFYSSIFDETNSLCFLNSNGLFYDTINLSPLILSTDPSVGLEYADNQMFVGNSSLEYSVADKDSRAKYYDNVRPVCLIDIETRNASSFGEFPVSYTKNSSNYCDWFPVVCPLKENSCLLSFACDDSIYLYNNGIKDKSILCKSKYINKFAPIKDDDFFDMGSYRKYSLSKPKYSELIHNCFTNEYYRVAQHAKKIENNGKLANDFVPSWSMIVMDSSFKVINEYHFKTNEYSPRIIVTSKDGVYVEKAMKNKEDRLTLTLFKL